MALYRAEIRKFPVLSAAEERHCAVKFYEEKDLEAAHSPITSNLRFVVKVSAREVVEMELRLKGEVCLDADLAESDGLTVLETL